MNKGIKITLLSLAFFSFLIETVKAQTLEWANSMGSTGLDVGSIITTDSSGNVYTAGYFQDSTDIDPGLDTLMLFGNGISVFIQKCDVSGNFIWGKGIASPGLDISGAIAIDGAGDVYVAGMFDGLADFDPGSDTFNLTPVGGRDAFLLKLDAGGNFMWAFNIGSSTDDSGWNIVLDAAGNVLMSGSFTGTCDFDPGPDTFNLTPISGHELFLMKTDGGGNFLWAKTAGARVAIDNSGALYMTGSFQGTVDFNPGPDTLNLTSAGGRVIFIQKLDSSGNLVWVKQIGSTGNDVGKDIEVDVNGDILVSGIFNGTVDFDPNSGVYNKVSMGDDDVFVQKVNVSGDLVWAETFGSTFRERSEGLAVDKFGSVYLTGNFEGMADFDPGPDVFNLTAVAAEDMYVNKLDGSGNFVWAQQIGSNNFEVALDIHVDAS